MRTPELQDLLARAIDLALDGTEPDLRALSGGDEDVARQLRVALDRALLLLPPRPLPAEAGGTPRRFGPYVVERELGHGGMSTVLLARHETLGRRAALKILPHPAAFVADNRERFRREACALGQLDHPAVLRVLEVGERDGIPFAALEYVPGGSLEDVLRELRGTDVASARERGQHLLPGDGPWEARVARLLAAVADALACVHAAGFVHRDVKPANILLHSDGRAILGDFGLALHGGLETLTDSGAILGTRRYLAPELTHPAAEATPATDLYALGVTLYELLTLQAPFRGDTETVLFAEIRERVPEWPRRLNRNMSPELQAVCLQAIEKTPSRRYVSAAAMAADLRAVIDGTPVAARGPSTWRRTWRKAWWRRQRWAVTGAALLAAGTLALGGLTWKQEREARAIERATADRAEYTQLFEKGWARLAADQHGTENWLLARRQEALECFLQCTRILPERVEPWLAAADAARRLGDSIQAESLLREARERGAQGFYLRWLEDWPAGFDPGTELPSPASCAEWSNIDKVALSTAYMRRRDLPVAYELLMDPALLGDPLLCVDLLQGTILGIDLATKAEIFQDRTAQARYALGSFDRFLQLHPGDPTVAYNRAMLIRDSVFRGLDLRASTSELLRSIEPAFRLQAETTGSANDYGELMKLLLTRWKYNVDGTAALDEALGEISDQSDGRLMGLEPVGYYSCVELLVVSGHYERALALLKQKNFDDVAEQRGPLHMLLLIRASYARAGLVSPDGEALHAFFADRTDGLAQVERDACEETLGELHDLASR